MKKLLLASLLLGSTSVMAAPFVVKDIRVNGIQDNTKQQFLTGLPVKVGNRITDNDIANITRMVFLRGYEDVRVFREANTLVISVQQRPIISHVVVKGSSVLPKEVLMQNLQANGFAEGQRLDREKLEQFRLGLVEHYQSIGRYNAKVETILTPTSDGSVALKLQIDEDDVVKFRTLTFNGNNVFSNSKLEGQMELQTDSWWKLFGNKFDNTMFAKDLEAIQTLYLDNGYAKFQITATDVKLTDDKKYADVTVDMKEGDQYTITDARIVGDVGGMSQVLAPLLNKITLNDIFRRKDVLAVEESIKVKLSEQGYANAQVNTVREFNDENKQISVTFVVDAGRRFSVRQIRFEGNTISADKTLRQEMRQQEGSWLSSQLVTLGKIRLERTGFFDSVESRFVDVENTNDQLDVVYTVKERNTGSINLGIGYGTESGFSYQASIKQDNFLGMGSSISLGGSRNDYGTTINLGYTEPYFTKDAVSLGGNVFYEDYNNSKNSTMANYARTTYGANINLGFPVNENNSYYVGLGYSYNKLKNITPEYNRELYRKSMNYDNWNFKSNDFDLSFGWNYNSLNRGFLPTSGLQASIGGKISIPGSTNKYYKISADVQGFYPITRDHLWVINGRAGISYANGFGGKRLPFYQNYAAGGIGSLRGFAYGAIGTNAIYADKNGDYNQVSDDIVGGNVMTTASLELIMPTPFVSDKNQHIVRTSVFIDAASVWDTHWRGESKHIYPGLPDYGDPKRVRASVGVGFQWQSPIGPLVFSYAKPIKKYQGDEIEQFQFTIGGSF